MSMIKRQVKAEEVNFNPEKKRNIVLIGFTGSGKDEVGQIIANQLGFNYINLDQIVEEITEDTIGRLYAQTSEKKFRGAEYVALKHLDTLNISNTVLTIGSGAAATTTNQNLIQKLGYVTWLNCSLETTLQRLKNGDYRLGNDMSEWKDKVSDLFYKYRFEYTRIADSELQVENLEFECVATMITDLASEYFTVDIRD